MKPLDAFAVLALVLFLGPTPIHAAQETPLRIVSYNVWNGFTAKPEPRHERWRAWMADRNADVVALQELNGFTLDRLEAEARAWGHPYAVLLKEDGFPTALTSRTPITEVRRIRDGMHHGLLRGRIRGVHFYVIHFHPSHHARRIEEAQHLIQDVASLAEPDPRIVMIGDFNGFSPADQPHYEADPKLVPFFAMLDEQYPGSRNLNSGKIDYGGIATILDAGYIDLGNFFWPSSAPFTGTFPTELRREEDLGPDRRLDYIFVSPNLLAHATYAVAIRDPTTGLLSDHYPLIAELNIPFP
jgi:endonuclease/exonuclease/phosphatase family metal-dependent hydrolase